MKFGGLLFISAAIFIAAAAPVPEVDTEDAHLQVALDDAVSSKNDAHTSWRRLHSNTRPVSASVPAEDFPDRPPSTTLREVTSYGIGDGDGNGKTHKPRRRRRLQVKQVPDHRLTNNEEQEAVDESEEAEMQAFSSLLQSIGNFHLPRSGTSTSGNTGTGTDVSRLVSLLPRLVGNTGGEATPGGKKYQVETEGLDGQRNEDTEEEETAGGSTTEEAEIERFKKFKSLLGKALRVLKYKLRSRSRSPGEDRKTVNNPTKWRDLGRNLLGIIGDKLDPSNENQNTEKEEEEEEEEEEEVAEEQLTEEAEIERFKKFKSLLGKTLRLLKYKLRSRSRTPKEDREAVKNPTKWRDLGRNLLGTIGDKLDPANGEESAEERNTEDAEIEKIKKIKKIAKKAIKAFGKLFKFIKRKVKSRSRISTEDRLDETNEERRRGNGNTNVHTEGGISFNAGDPDLEGEEVIPAEIEGFKSFLSKALRLINRKPKPTSRTPDEEREAVNNPLKWTDLGRNFLNVLREKIDQSSKRSRPGEEAEIEGPFFDLNTDRTRGDDEIAEEETIGRLARKLMRLVRRIGRSG